MMSKEVVNKNDTKLNEEDELSEARRCRRRYKNLVIPLSRERFQGGRVLFSLPHFVLGFSALIELR